MPRAPHGSRPSSPTTRRPSGGRHRAVTKPRNDEREREANMIRIVLAALAIAVSAHAALVRDAWAAQVTYYQLPSGAYPHDVAPAPDGTVYYSGQRKGVLGIFDPKTGKNEEV